jgi:hypothetical protein
MAGRQHARADPWLSKTAHPHQTGRRMCGRFRERTSGFRRPLLHCHRLVEHAQQARVWVWGSLAYGSPSGALTQRRAIASAAQRWRAELLPELIELDEVSDPITGDRGAGARHAPAVPVVGSDCPTLATWPPTAWA